jgi:hypothetical protein
VQLHHDKLQIFQSCSKFIATRCDFSDRCAENTTVRQALALAPMKAFIKAKQPQNKYLKFFTSTLSAVASSIIWGGSYSYIPVLRY